MTTMLRVTNHGAGALIVVAADGELIAVPPGKYADCKAIRIHHGRCRRPDIEIGPVDHVQRAVKADLARADNRRSE